MNVSLTADLSEFVDQHVAKGSYRSRDEVIAAALGLLRDRERQTSQLNAMIREAEADVRAGRVRSATEVRERLREHHQATPAL